MKVLRSREIPSAPAKSRPRKSDIQPSTPARLQEPSVHRSPYEVAPESGPVDETTRRRSLRLAHHCEGDDECVIGLIEKEVSISVCGKGVSNVDDKKVLSLRSGKKVAKRGVDYGLNIESRKLDFDVKSSNMLGTGSKRKRDFVEENFVRQNSGESGLSGDYVVVNGDVKVDSPSRKRANEENGKTLKADRSAIGMLGDSLLEDFAEVEKEMSCYRVKSKGKGIVEDSYEDDDVQMMIGVESYENSGRMSMGKRKYTWEEKGKGIQVKNKGKGIVEDSYEDNDLQMMTGVESYVNSGRMSTGTRKYMWEDKGKGVQVKNNGKGIVEDSYEDNDVQMMIGVESYENSGRIYMGTRKYTWEEKGKGIQVENNSSPITNEIAEVGVEEMEIENLINNDKPSDAPVEQTQIDNSNAIGNASRTRHFRDIAKRNASKFAHSDAQMEEEEDLSDREGVQQFEDWPGPFSTAMKIIKDREENTDLCIGTSVSNKGRSSPTIWVPRRNYSIAPRGAPSLQELSLQILVKNADAISSLDYVPDALRVKLCQLLCDSRRMNVHFLDLLLHGSPTEVCVPDCSWLTEEQFTECFKNCNTSNLMILQLNKCGFCMPDYVLHFTLAKSPKSLPMLSSLSLSGAYRLSDVGLRALVSSAPAITSINLSQCSLLTSSSIDMLSDILGSLLRELYINECQNIDLKLILPALKKFEKLEVLSLAGLPSVRGRFLREFVIARGQTLKQLILTNSVKLTDSSVKVISENCPSLSVLDLANVCKLTDLSMGYLANGCRALEKLFICRNSFSDEAVAAFVEIAGSSLKELSLNNVKKVGHNTALALAKLAEKLQILDVSFCRDMSDDLLGYIVDNCLSLKVLKLFGCTQVTNVFVKGHSNPNVKIVGVKMDPFLGHLTNRLC